MMSAEVKLMCDTNTHFQKRRNGVNVIYGRIELEGILIAFNLMLKLFLRSVPTFIPSLVWPTSCTAACLPDTCRTKRQDHQHGMIIA